MGQIFHNNVKNLEQIGSKRLEAMLQERDWSDLPIISSHAKRRQQKTHTVGMTRTEAHEESEQGQARQVEAVVEYLAQSSGADGLITDHTDMRNEPALSVNEQWREYRTEDGTPYYHNEVSGEVSWHAPLDMWREYQTDDGIPYYYNAALGESGGRDQHHDRCSVILQRIHFPSRYSFSLDKYS